MKWRLLLAVNVIKTYFIHILKSGIINISSEYKNLKKLNYQYGFPKNQFIII